MNRTVKLVSFSLALVFSTQVFAGRDELQILQQNHDDEAVAAKQLSNPADENKEDLLGHGPRAETTQWVNKSERINDASKESPPSAGDQKSENTPTPK